MKTQISVSRLFTFDLMSVTLLTISAMFLASCSKDDSIAPDSSQADAARQSILAPAEPAPAEGLHFATQDAKSITPPPITDPPLPSNLHYATVAEKQANLSSAPVFNTIIIDHYAGRTRLADYSITINRDGTVLYEGRANVRVKGLRTLKLSEQAMQTINGLSKRYMNISLPASALAGKDEKDLAGAMNVTTYVNANKSLRLRYVDYNTGMPEWLVYYRTEVEKAVDLKALLQLTATIAEVNK